MKIKVLVSILALIAILTTTGCENDNGASQMPELEESFSSTGGESMSCQVSVYVGEDKLLHMYDPKQGDSIILCNKADCSHEPYDEQRNPDPTCEAALNKELFSSCVPVLSNNYLYLFGVENMSQGVVYRENLDGSGRTRMYSMDYQLGMGSSVYVKNNVAYAEANIPIVNEDNLGGAGTNSSYSLMLQINLETGETKELSPIRKEKFQGVSLLEIKGNQLYYVLSYRKLQGEEKDYSKTSQFCSVYGYDIKSGKQTKLFLEEDLTGLTPVGMTGSSLCVCNEKTGEAFEISLKDKSKKSIYLPPNKDVIYFVFNNQWIVGDMSKEQFSCLKDNELEVLPDIVSFSKTFGNYVEYYLKDGTCQVIYGTLLSDKPIVVLEKK